YEPAVIGRGGDEDGQGDREGQAGEAVEDDRYTLWVTVADIFGDELGRERDERDEQEHQQVEPVQRRIGRTQGARDRGVLKPDAPDRQKAREVGEVRRPLVQDRPEQMVAGVGRDTELEHEERDRDCEHAVAERLETVERQLLPLECRAALGGRVVPGDGHSSSEPPTGMIRTSTSGATCNAATANASAGALPTSRAPSTWYVPQWIGIAQLGCRSVSALAALSGSR